jgi:hypothetical protein
LFSLQVRPRCLLNSSEGIFSRMNLRVTALAKVMDIPSSFRLCSWADFVWTASFDRILLKLFVGASERHLCVGTELG